MAKSTISMASFNWIWGYPPDHLQLDGMAVVFGRTRWQLNYRCESHRIIKGYQRNHLSQMIWLKLTKVCFFSAEIIDHSCLTLKIRWNIRWQIRCPSRLPIPESWSDFRRWGTPTRNSRLALPLATTGPSADSYWCYMYTYMRLCNTQGHHVAYIMYESVYKYCITV